MNGSAYFAPVVPEKDDPAWQPPRDPLASGKAKARAQVIHREVPLVTVQTKWTIPQLRTALETLSEGQFDQPAQLVDAILGDDRVQATLGSRTGGLFGCPIRHFASDLPGVDPKEARACLDAWKLIWPRTLTEPVLAELHGKWGVMLGFGFGQLIWDTSGDIWVPYLKVFNPRYSYFHPTLRVYVAITLDGQEAVIPGDGHWVLHAPHGPDRGWMHGSLRAIAQPWIIRALAYRDWARWSERHGLPIFKALTPAAADDVDRTRFLNQLANLGQESVVELSQAADQEFSYGLEMLEASDGSWQGFDGIIQRCEMSIVLALLGQNLTTEVKEGSFAAARVHSDVRQSFLQADARVLSQTIYTQIARPFAEINFGNADLAPTSEWDVTPSEDRKEAAMTLMNLAMALNSLRLAGWTFEDLDRIGRALGLDLASGALTKIAPTQVEVAQQKSEAPREAA
jgi:hypothetical protein